MHRVAGRRPTARPDLDTVVGDHARVRIRAWHERDGTMCVEIGRAGSGRAVMRMRIRVRGQPTIDGVPPWATQWTMVAGMAPGRFRCEPFHYLLTETAGLALPGRRNAGERDRLAAARIGSVLRATFHSLAAETARACEPTARAIALRFAPCVRWWIYTRIVADGTGWIGQAALACPGMLVFAFALAEHEPFAAASRRLLADIREGVALTAALDRAIEHWHAHAWTFVAMQGPNGSDVWSRLFAARGVELERMLRCKRLLVRRAGGAVAPTLLLLPPPIVVVPEDIPVGGRRNATWFRAMFGNAATMTARDGAENLQAGVLRMISAQSWAIGKVRTGRAGHVARLLLDYCVALRRAPDRRSNAVLLVRKATKWFRMLANAGLPVAAKRARPSELTSIPIAGARGFEFRDDGLRVRALATIGEVLEEGETMRNCVARYLHAAMSGACVLCHATVGSEELTVQLSRSPQGIAIVAIAGFANEAGSSASVAAITRWVASLAVTHGMTSPRPSS